MKNSGSHDLKDILRCMSDMGPSPIGTGWIGGEMSERRTEQVELPERAPDRWRRTNVIDTDELDEILTRTDGCLLVDVRAPARHDAARIPGALNIPADDPAFLERIRAIAGSRYDRVVLYSESFACPLSRRTAALLDNAGFKHVAALDGGLHAWAQADRELEGAIGDEAEQTGPR